MVFTERDLQLAEWHVSTLERFIHQHKKLIAQTSWPPDIKVEAEKLLAQFEDALQANRRRRDEIWSEIHASS